MSGRHTCPNHFSFLAPNGMLDPVADLDVGYMVHVRDTHKYRYRYGTQMKKIFTQNMNVEGEGGGGRVQGWAMVV